MFNIHAYKNILNVNFLHPTIKFYDLKLNNVLCFSHPVCKLFTIYGTNLNYINKIRMEHHNMFITSPEPKYLKPWRRKRTTALRKKKPFAINQPPERPANKNKTCPIAMNPTPFASMLLAHCRCENKNRETGSKRNNRMGGKRMDTSRVCVSVKAAILKPETWNVHLKTPGLALVEISSLWSVG